MPKPTAKILIARPGTDAALRREWTGKGRDARRRDEPLDACPYPPGQGRMLADWWRQGWREADQAGSMPEPAAPPAS